MLTYIYHKVVLIIHISYRESEMGMRQIITNIQYLYLDLDHGANCHPAGIICKCQFIRKFLLYSITDSCQLAVFFRKFSSIRIEYNFFVLFTKSYA